MRALLLIAGSALLLTGCGNNDQTDKTQNADENLTAESIVSNDVTAIDAVTGDAANMAADADMNFGVPDENGAALANEAAPRSTRRPAEKTAPTPGSNATANAVSNTQ